MPKRFFKSTKDVKKQNYEELGTVSLVEDGWLFSSCDDMGGKTLVDTTVEADYWVYKKFGVAAFYDSTMITEKSLDFQILTQL